MITELKLKKDPVQKARDRSKKKFIHYFKKGYHGPKYMAWERQYKLDAHIEFQNDLNRNKYKQLLIERAYEKIAALVIRIESKTNLLFSFEKMALRDALKTPDGAKSFAEGLFEYVYGNDSLQNCFEAFVNIIAGLRRIQTRVLTWPIVTVFGFISNPKEHLFLKPRVTQIAAAKYHFDFLYQSRPNWNTYQSLQHFGKQIWKDTSEFKPSDYIDVQSFIWVMGSDEYPD